MNLPRADKVGTPFSLEPSSASSTGVQPNERGAHEERSTQKEAPGRRAAWKLDGRGGWLVIPALILFVVGILAPSIVVNELGNVRRLSLLGGIQALWTTGHMFLAVVIFVFTVLFPSVKLALTGAIGIPSLPLAATTRIRLRRTVECLGRWSLLDVLVIAVLIVAVKVEGLVSVKAAWGIYAFTFSIVLSMLATHFLKTRRSNPSGSIRSASDSRFGSGRRMALRAVALALAVFGTIWLILAPRGIVEMVLVTKKETFVELPRFFGNPSFFLQVQTLAGVQRLDAKPRTPIGNGLIWTLKQPVPLKDVYQLEIFDGGILVDKLVDRVTITGRQAVGERFRFELKGRRDWQRPAALIMAALGIGLLIFNCRRTKGISP